MSSIQRIFARQVIICILNSVKKLQLCRQTLKYRSLFFFSFKYNPWLSIVYISHALFAHQRSTYLLSYSAICLHSVNIFLSMENSSSSPRKGELVESMFKSLNSYTSELQQGLLTFLCFIQN